MTREIKFRGKRLDNGKWIFGDLIENQGRFFIYHATSETTIEDSDDGRISIVAVEVDPATVGQFTEEFDYFDNEIYEGDFVMYPECVGYEEPPYSCRPVYNSTPHEVFFDEGCFWLLPKYRNNDALKLCDSMEYNPRVAGNVHDNPELLKK